MDTTALNALTNRLAKTDDTEYLPADKLADYNLGYGVLYSLLIDQQEDNYEQEDTKTTVADQREYQQKARIHHINWLKIDYGSGFIPARYRPEDDLIAQYGSRLETVLSQWDPYHPIYWYKGKHFFVVPTVTADQAGADRLKASMELFPADLEDGDTPDLPEPLHSAVAAYAAMNFLDEEDALWKKAKRIWDDCVSLIPTLFPRAREREMVAGTPDDDGSNY